VNVFNYVIYDFIIPLLISISLLMVFIKIMINYKYGYDLHKREKIKVPEMGGIIPVLISGVLLISKSLPLSFIMFISGIVGAYDDLYKLSPIKKLTVLFLIGLIVGYLLFGFDIVKLIIIGLGVSISSNLTNMLAGFNGLEIGLGVISAIFLGILLFLSGDYEGLSIILIFIGSYLGLLLFNKYPSKVFPGDVGTLPIGAFLFTVSFWKGLLLEYIIIMIPYIIDATLKYYSAGITKREDHKPTTIGNDGKLYVSGGYLSLPRIILLRYPMEEYKIVILIWGISILCGILSILVYFLFNSH